MSHEKTMKYVLDNLIDQKQCTSCLGMWFLFNHEGCKAYYRLSPVPPESCDVCRPIDEEIESNCIVSKERWVEL